MRRTDPSPATVRLIRERDRHACARCGCENGLTTQHRVARGMGGTRAPWINQPANLLTLCGSGTTGCHGWTEHHPAEARELGLSVSRNGLPPERVPVWTWRGWLLLDPHGAIEYLPHHAGVEGCSCGCQSLVPSPGLWDLPD